MARSRQSAKAVEEEVQERLPHLRLVDRSSYEAKGRPAWWRCTLHDRIFRAKASALVRAGAVGCPDCLEAKALDKRIKHLADAQMDRHLAMIAESLGEAYAQTHRLRCSGKKLKEIGAIFRISEQAVCFRLARIKAVLEKVQSP